MASEFRLLGLIVDDRKIPRTNHPQHPESRGDLHIKSHGLCIPSQRTHLNHYSGVVLDVSLVHSILQPRSPATPTFHPNRVRNTERTKLKEYRRAYLPHYGFSPLVGDSFGRIGDMTLRFFHRIAYVVAHQSCDSDPSSSSYHHYLFRRLCSTFQSLCICATAQRLTRGDFLNRSHVCGTEPGSESHFSPAHPQSPSSSSETIASETIPSQPTPLSSTPSDTHHTPLEPIEHIGFELFGATVSPSTPLST